MSERRKPELVFFAEIRGIGTGGKATRKRLAKIELFPAHQWNERPSKSKLYMGINRGDTYRIRVDGKWWNGVKTFTLSQFFAIYRGAVARSRDKFRRKTFPQ